VLLLLGAAKTGLVVRGRRGQEKRERKGEERSVWREGEGRGDWRRVWKLLEGARGCARYLGPRGALTSDGHVRAQVRWACQDDVLGGLEKPPKWASIGLHIRESHWVTAAAHQFSLSLFF
jgi:hypothetical protein